MTESEAGDSTTGDIIASFFIISVTAVGLSIVDNRLLQRYYSEPAGALFFINELTAILLSFLVTYYLLSRHYY